MPISLKKFLSFLEKSQENGPLQTNIKTERSRGLGRKTREETGKGNQMTALRFQTGGTSHIPSLHFVGQKQHSSQKVKQLEEVRM